jgi:hypothetical protein
MREIYDRLFVNKINLDEVESFSLGKLKRILDGIASD